MTMPAGRYYIGDLCYVMHDEWDEACALFFPSYESGRGVEGEFQLRDGRCFASFGTAWGDGEYYNNMGTSHCVDSGSIGCIRVADIRDDTYGNLESLGSIVEFKEPFEVEKVGRGLLKFGHVEIETDPVYDEEY
jgi:hypothetical protein